MADELDDALAALGANPPANADEQDRPAFSIVPTPHQAPAMPPAGTPAPADEVDQALGILHQTDTQERLGASADVGLKQPKASSTKTLQLFGRTGLPYDFIERNQALVDAESQRAEFDPERFMKESPAFASWMAEAPTHVSAAAEDATKLSFIEKQLRYVPQMFEKGQLQDEYGDVMFEVAKGMLDRRDVTELRRRQADLERRMQAPDLTGLADMPGPGGWAARAPGWVAQQLPILGSTLGQQIRSGATGLAGGAVLGASVGGAPMAAAGGLVVGGVMWRIGAAQNAARLEFAQALGEYEKLKDAAGNPLDFQTALGLAGLVAVVNGSIDGFFGLEGLSSKLPGVNQFTRQGVKELLKSPTAARALLSYARTIGATMATEGVTEVIQMYITKAGGTALKALKDGGSVGQWVAEIFSPENIAQSATEFEAGAMGGGGIAIGLAAPNLAQQLGRVRAAQRRKEAFEAIGDATKSAKFAEELPGPLRDIVERATKGGPVEQVYVPAEAWNTYFQDQGVDPREVYREVTGDLHSYDTAEQTGGDLPIKTADYVQKLAGTDHNEFLAQQLRFSPDEMNAAEAAAWVKEQDEASLAAAQQEGLRVAKAEDVQERIRQDIAAQLEAAGFPPAVVDQYAALVQERYAARAARRGLGEDPAALFERVNLMVQRDLPAILRQLTDQQSELDALLDRLRANDYPKPSEMYGPSLHEYLAERGGLQDQGGELSRMDVDAAKRPFQKHLIQPTGHPLDYGAALAHEAGYISERDVHQFMDALDREARGALVYAPGNEKAALVDVQQNLESLKKWLEDRGIDVMAMPNQEIKRLLGEAVQQSLPLPPEGTTFEQRAPETVFYSRLLEVVNEKMGGKMPAADLKKMLLANGVKPDEIKWVDLDEFLTEHPIVKKDELLAFLSKHLVVINPIVLGAPTGLTEGEFLEKYKESVAELREMGWDTTVAEDDSGLVEMVGFMEIGNEDAEIVSAPDLPNVQPGELTVSQAEELLGPSTAYTDMERLDSDLGIRVSGSWSKVWVFPDTIVSHARQVYIAKVYAHQEYVPFMDGRRLPTVESFKGAQLVVARALKADVAKGPITAVEVNHQLRRMNVYTPDSIGVDDVIEELGLGVTAQELFRADEQDQARTRILSIVTFDVADAHDPFNPDPSESTKIYMLHVQRPNGTSYFEIPVGGNEREAEDLDAAKRILYEEFVIPELFRGERPSQPVVVNRRTPQAVGRYLEQQVIDSRKPKGSHAVEFASLQTRPGEGRNYREALLRLEPPIPPDLPDEVYYYWAPSRDGDGYSVFRAALGQQQHPDTDELAAGPALTEPEAKRLAGEFYRDQREREDALWASQPEQYEKGHYRKVTNVLAHVRLNDRVDAQGRRLLYIEEVQSDWHQTARDLRKAEVGRIAEERNIKKGTLAYKAIEAEVPVDWGYRMVWPESEIRQFRVLPPVSIARSGDVGETNAEALGPTTGLRHGGYAQGTYVIVDGRGHVVATPTRTHSETPEQALDLVRRAARTGALYGYDKVPRAPFMKTEQWATLGLKYLLWYATKGGYDAVAWTPGHVQNERYRLSQRIGQVRYERNEDGSYHLWITPKDGGDETDVIRHTSLAAVPPAQLPDYLGADLAEKVVAGHSTPREVPTLEELTEVTGSTVFNDPDVLAGFGYQGGRRVTHGVRYRDGSMSGYASYGEALMELMRLWALNRGSTDQELVDGLAKVKSPKSYATWRAIQIGQPTQQVIRGVDLDIAGGGMKSFYDHMVKNIMNEIGKKWGAKVSTTQLNVGGSKNIPAPSAPLTPTFTAMTEADLMGYDLTGWAEDDPPRQAEVQIVLGGQRRDVMVFVSRAGLHLQGVDEQENPFEYFADMDDLRLPWGTGHDAAAAVTAQWPVHGRYSIWKKFQRIHGMENLNVAANLGPVVGDASRRIVEAPGLEVQMLPVTDKMRATVGEKGFPLFQKGGKDAKGKIVFADGQVNISLLEKADLSTFLHEMGHLHLNELIDDAFTEGTPDQLRTDLDTLLAWMGLAVRVADGRVAVAQAIGRDQHEQFARGFEAYLMEGKSPSQRLRDAFDHFRRWLIQVYHSLTTAPLAVKLTPAVRGVMDRLIATDEALAAAEAQAEVEPMFSDAVQAGMGPTEFAAYRETVAEASRVAREQLQKQLMAQYAEQQHDWWKKEREKVEAEVTAEVDDQDAYVALAVLRTGKLPDGSDLPADIPPFKLDRKAIADMMGRDFLRTVPRGTTKWGGMHPDEAARLFGYGTGQELLLGIINARPRKALIEAETDRRMRERFGDMRTDGSIADAAKEAVYNEKREEVIAAELRALNKLRRLVKPFVQAERTEAQEKQRAARQLVHTMIPTLEEVRQLAANIISRTAIGAVNPDHYIVAARQASRKATEAFLRQDAVDAGHYKQQELLNLALYREALKVRDEQRRVHKLVTSVTKPDPGLAKTRNVDLVNVARAILAQYRLTRPPEKTAAEYLRAMQTYDPDVYNYWAPQIAQVAPREIDWRAITVGEYRRMHDNVRAVWDLSRRLKFMKINDQLVAREAVVDDLIAGVQAFTPAMREQVVGAQTAWADTKMGLLSWRSALRRVESWVRAMDGGNMTGVFRQSIWTPISEASDVFRAARVEMLQRYLTLLKPIEKGLTRDLIPAPELGPGVAFRGKVALVHALLHTGNESNQDKLLRGYQWEPANWQAFIGRMQTEGVLTKEVYDFVQGVWDLLEGIKPEAQRAHHEMYGHYFDEITARAFQTPWGTYRGGYVPAIADRNVSVDAAIREEKDALDQAGNAFMFPTTGRGFTKARVQQYAAPLQLDLATIPAHIDKTMRFIHLEPRIKDAARLITNKRFRQALDALDPTAAKDMLVPWLQRSAQQKVTAPGKNRHIDALFRYLRKATGAQIMVGNVINTLQQFTGVSIALTRVKARYLRGALARYLRHPIDTAADVHAKSAFMKGRNATQVIEVQQTIDDIILNPTKFEKARAFADRHGYFMQQGTQNVVDLVTWGGAYDQAIERGADEREAVREADAAVRETQGSFAPEDISAFEGGTPFVRAFSMFYSYFNMQANLLQTEWNLATEQMGIRRGAGRAFYVYVVGFMIPAIVAEGILRSLAGFDPGDDDSYLDEALSLLFLSQLRSAFALAPVVGPITLAGINTFNNKWYDDRISTSPILTLMESVVRAPHSLYQAMSEEGHSKRAIRDVLTFIGLVTGLPMGALMRPLGYVGEVTDGVAKPETPLDVARGLLSGRDVNRQK